MLGGGQCRWMKQHLWTPRLQVPGVFEKWGASESGMRWEGRRRCGLRRSGVSGFDFELGGSEH